MYDLTVFYGVGLDKKQSYAVFEYVSSVCHALGWWEAAGCLISEHDAILGPSCQDEFVNRLNAIWWWLASKNTKADFIKNKKWIDRIPSSTEISENMRKYPLVSEEKEKLLKLLELQ
jgi:hypothetical protein